MYAKNTWEKYKDQLNEVFDYNEGYKHYISKNKTERACVKDSIKLAEEKGFKPLESFDTLKSGDKVYVTNRGKNIALFIIGKKPLTEGMRILGAHIDSPRMDLKQNPLYESEGFTLADTHYYGGIKKYQWVTIPLSLYGVVCKKDGTVVDVVIGEDENDPVVGISDLLIHLSADQLDKKAAKVIEGENLDVTLGNMPLFGEEKDAVKANILKLLKEDKEEIGSVGATGAHSLFFENTVAELLLKMGIDSFVQTRLTMSRSKMLSSDVSAGVDPLFVNVNDKKNAAYLGNGIVFNKYTGSRGKSGSNDASAEYVAQVRAVMDNANIHYQTAELGRVDQGGGGTIAYILGNYNMDVIDAGIAVLNMHAPMEIVSKVDVYETYQAYKAFLKDA